MSEIVKNFMGGESYTLTPLLKLRIIAASSIFGEPQFYREGLKSPANIDTLKKYDQLGFYTDNKETSVSVFTKAIDESLDYDFMGTLELAKKLRHEFLMRLNPAVIFIRSVIHPKRVDFNKENPGLMKQIGMEIIGRPDDITNQFEYYKFLKGGKNNLPSLVKRVWADKLSEMNKYQIKKYKSKNLIDLVRISHANSDIINELMRTGDVVVESTDMTWETLRSQGKKWVEIVDTINIPHMALLRNLRNIFSEIKDKNLTKDILTKLLNGVKNGKQFPFRYYTAYNEILSSNVNNKELILNTLEECVSKSIENLPKLKGKVICLSDNSGSAWGGFTSEYGKVTVAEISNLSSIITSLNSDEGYVGVFGDSLDIKPVTNREGILTQLKETCSRGKNQGGGTEHGIWVFLRNAIDNKEFYDHIVIFSDQQCGHGGLYGTSINPNDRHKNGRNHIDLLKMVEDYRKNVNPKVNVTTVQVGGYSNSVVPENLYRTSILGGWTGKETIYIKEMCDIWDKVEVETEQEVL
jgi:hypothetical protein